MAPVEARDAASLIIVRDGPGGAEVLMGRRKPDARFAAGAYVFPGGQVDAGDAEARAATLLKRSELDLLTRSCDADFAHTLAKTAVRETFEESGLVVGLPGDVGPVEGATWGRIRDMELAPALDRLDYVGRAITPEASPIRFHARFFMARFEDAAGEIGGDGELLDLRWVPLERTSGLALIDVTEFMIGEIRRLLAAPAGAPRGRVFTYRAGGAHIGYD